ncbi:hypothetical protein NL676_032940 [Syzygium grande]|nr:hypothetical protein NL676_032940 [Syzygium grande]
MPPPSSRPDLQPRESQARLAHCQRYLSPGDEAADLTTKRATRATRQRCFSAAFPSTTVFVPHDESNRELLVCERVSSFNGS